MATLEDAIELAVQAHRRQTDKIGRPYILHPLRVMMRMATDEERMAAVLHDVVEDTPVTLADLLEAGFPEEVVQAVDCLTRREQESYDAFIARLKVNPLAVRVKLGDLEDNMDIRRLPAIGEEDMERLRKYRRVWETLSG